MTPPIATEQGMRYWWSHLLIVPCCCCACDALWHGKQALKPTHEGQHTLDALSLGGTLQDGAKGSSRTLLHLQAGRRWGTDLYIALQMK